jgi:two-component system NtrC family response regulator
MTDFSIASILAIEDDPADQTLMRVFFERGSLCNRLDFARDMQEAAQLMHAHDYDVIFVDIHLPDANGLDYAIALNERYPDKQIVILSGAHDDAMVQKAADAGIFGYILKPLNHAVLTQLVEASPQLYLALVVDQPRISRI